MSHEGEEFMVCHRGAVEFRTVDRVEILEAGDSIYFESDLSHSLRCVSEKPAKAISAVWSRPDPWRTQPLKISRLRDRVQV